MTKTLSLKAGALSLMLLALAAATLAAQLFSAMIRAGLNDSASVRVSLQDVCNAAPDAHFTGCSSIL